MAQDLKSTCSQRRRWILQTPYDLGLEVPYTSHILWSSNLLGSTWIKWRDKEFAEFAEFNVLQPHVLTLLSNLSFLHGGFGNSYFYLIVWRGWLLELTVLWWFPQVHRGSFIMLVHFFLFPESFIICGTSATPMLDILCLYSNDTPNPERNKHKAVEARGSRNIPEVWMGCVWEVTKEGVGRQTRAR